MVDKRANLSGKKVRKPSSFVYKLGDEEIKLFLMVLKTLMSQVPAPLDARSAYLLEVEKRLRNNGAGFLSLTRSFPTLGLKLLGNDLTGFPVEGLRCQEGKVYPRLFAWYWSELERFSKVANPTERDARYVRKILSVLSFAKMIRTSSVNQIAKALSSFEKRVSPPTEQSSLQPFTRLKGVFGRPAPAQPDKNWFEQGPNLELALGTQVALDTLPKNLDLDNFSNKPSALRDPIEFPEWFEFQFLGTLPFDRGPMGDEGPQIGFKPPPYGVVQVLTEYAGKLRLIVPYNTPFVHSTGLFARCRAHLSQLRQDCSVDQAAGHRFVQRELTRNVDDWCVSADLSNFTDDISPDALKFGLSSLDLTELSSFLFNLPVQMPNGSVITPKRLLMGLKGCFELGSLLHHYVIRRSGIERYTMCGDDLFFIGDVSSYVHNLRHLGPSLNRGKTVISKTVAVFCGEYYWFGYRVKPVSVKVSSFYRNGSLRDTPVLFSALRGIISSLDEVYKAEVVLRVTVMFLRLLRRRWKSALFLNLPAKLGGFGIRLSRDRKGLVQRLESSGALRCAKLSVGHIQEKPASTRWFGLPVELSPSGLEPEFDFLPALLKKGAVRLEVAPMIRYRKDINTLNLYNVLEWYYHSARLEFNRSRKTGPFI